MRVRNLFIDGVFSNAVPHTAPPDGLASLSAFRKGGADKFKEARMPEDTARSKDCFADTNGKWKIFGIVGSESHVYKGRRAEFSQPRSLANFHT